MQANNKSVIFCALLTTFAFFGARRTRSACQDRRLERSGLRIFRHYRSRIGRGCSPRHRGHGRLNVRQADRADLGRSWAQTGPRLGYRRRWFDTEGVDAIFDIYSSGVALAVQGVAEQKNKLLVVSMASSRDISGKSCSPNGMQWANDGYEVANLTIKGSSGDKPTSWFS